jgi:hypothetical protein
VSKWPDETERDRKAIDCIARSKTNAHPPLAIEHTEMAVLSKVPRDGLWREDGVWFQKLADQLEEEPWTKWPGLSIEVTFPYELGQKGPKNLPQMVRAELRRVIPGLSPTGVYAAAVAGLPKPMLINKRAFPSGGGRFYVARSVPEKLTLDEEILAAFGCKREKLLNHDVPQAKTIMLLESRDVALTDPVSIYSAVFAVAETGATGGLDHVWLAYTCEGRLRPTTDFYCLSGPQDVCDRANPPNFRFGPRHDDYWRRCRDPHRHVRALL